MTSRASLTAVVIALGVALGVALGLESVAVAQAPLHGDIATADALYQEGRRLAAERRFAEACGRFEGSMSLLPRLGVQLNVAECYERLGKIASAWVAYGEAAALAHRMADTREALAWQRREALEPRLSRLAITVAPGASVADLVVKRDGAEVPRSAFGVGIPVDPGEHIVEATAPDRVGWSARVVVVHEAEIAGVTIPELARTGVAASLAPTPRLGARRPTLATWLVAGTGAASMAAGVVLGVSARSLWRQARPGCDSSNACSDAALALVERSRRDGNLSSAAFVVGGAALLTSAILYLRSPREREDGVRVGPALSSRAIGLTVAGGF